MKGGKLIIGEKKRDEYNDLEYKHSKICADAENYVIGVLLTDSDSIPTILNIVEGSDFYFSTHRTIFNAIKYLSENEIPVDLLSVRQRLIETKDFYEIGGARTLTDLAEAIVGGTYYEHHAKRVKEFSRLRRLVNACLEIATVGMEPGAHIDDVASLAAGSIEVLLEEASSIVNLENRDIETQFDEYLDRVLSSEIVEPIKMPWDGLNRITKGGIVPGEYVVIAGRPSLGKSSLALNILWSVVCSGKKGMYISLEMGEAQIFNRLLANIADIDVSHFRSGSMLDNRSKELIKEKRSEIINKKLIINDSPRLTMSKIRNLIKNENKKSPVDILVIDYLQLCTPERRENNREREVAEMSRQVKLMAKEFNIPVLLLCQLNRELEKQKRRPIMADLRESGAIEQDADIIMFLHSDRSAQQDCDEVELVVAKGRDSGIGICNLKFDRQHQRFEGSSDLAYKAEIQAQQAKIKLENAEVLE